MKKNLMALACSIALAATASADIGRVEMGAGAWMQTPSGDITYTESGLTASDVSEEKEETSPYVWLLIKHPIPVLPNLRLEYVTLANTGTATGKFKDFEPTTTPAKTTLDMTQYDIIPYYNILDNTAWITLDLGIDLKVIDVDYKAEGVTVNYVTNTTYNDTASVVIPLAYVRARMEIPATNIGLESDVKYISNGSSTVYDIRAKVDYTLDFIPVVQPAIELGYRVQKFKIDDADVNGKMDLDFAGVYAGLMARF